MRHGAASYGLSRLIVERKLTQPGDPELNRHIAATIAKKTGRGWRIDKLSKSDQVDATVALAMTAEGVEDRPPAFKLLAVL